MSVDQKTVLRVARLSRLAVGGAEVERLVGELNPVLQFVDMLEEVNVDNIEPMTTVVPHKLKRREDVVTDGEIQSKIMANAPKAEEGFFLVPKVVE